LEVQLFESENMLKKHKQVTKWVAGLGLFDDKLYIVQAILIETPKMFKLKEGLNTPRIDRMFSARAGYKKQWNKDKAFDRSLLHDSEMDAVQAVIDYQESSIDKARKVLSSREYYLELIEKQVKHCEWETVKGA